MAWVRDIDFKALLQTVKSWVFDANIGVADSKSSPTFVEAFRGDAVAANKAAHAFWRFWLNSDFDPDSRNYVDQLGDVGQTSGTDEFGRGATVAPDGNIWYSEVSALVVSGDKTLVFRNVASPTPDSFIYRVGMPFKLSEDRTYRCTVRWTSDTAARGIGVTVSKLDRTKTFDSATGMTPTIVTPNTFQYDSFVFQASGTANICHGLVYVFKDTSVSSDWNLYVDEILIEPIGQAFSVTTSNGDTIAANTPTKVRFNSEVFDYGGGWDNVTNFRFNVTEPGLYHFNATLGITNLAIDTFCRAHLYVNGAVAKSGPYFGFPVAVAAGSGQVSAYLALNSGDYVEAYVEHTDADAGAEAVSTTATFTYFTGSRVS